MSRRLLLVSALCLLSVACTAFAAETATSVPTAAAIQLTLPGKPAIAVTASTLATLPRKEVRAATHEEPLSSWQGVALVDVLRQAGAPLDKQLRGREMAKFVRVTATDGYQIVFSLAELDAGFGNTTVLLVDQHEGKALSAEEGPFRLVVPGDKRAARWLRSLRSIELVDAATTPANSAH